MTPSLTTLEHLSYILECVAADYMGEAKTELDRLSQAVDDDPKYDLPLKKTVAPELHDALALYNRSQYREGTSILSRISRQIWKQVIQAEA